MFLDPVGCKLCGRVNLSTAFFLVTQQEPYQIYLIAYAHKPLPYRTKLSRTKF